MSDTPARTLVGPADSLPEGQQTAVDVAGVSVLVVHHDGQFYALRNNCTHKDFPLLGGWQDGRGLTDAQTRPRMSTGATSTRLAPGAAPRA